MNRIQTIAARWAVVLFTVFFWSAALSALSGCAATAQSFCDPSGLCHPDTPLHVGKPILLRFDTPASINTKARAMAQAAKGSAMDVPAGYTTYAFTLHEGPFCQIYLPEPKGWSDTRFQSLFWHELRHCAEGNYHS